MEKKNDFTQREIRLFEDIIQMLYKDCYSTMRIHKWVKEEMGLKDSRAFDYIRMAKAYFGEYVVDKNNDILLECLEILRENREKAVVANNLKEVRENTIEIGKLAQLYIKKVEQDLNIKTEQPLFGDDEDEDDD